MAKKGVFWGWSMGAQGKTGNIKGCYSLLITPFEEDGRVDLFAFERLLEQQKEGGVDGVAVAFPQAEGGVLKPEEYALLIGQAALVFEGGVVASGMALSTEGAAELARIALDRGADALFCPPPPGTFSGQPGYFKHLRALSEASSLPLILSRSGGKSGLALCGEQLSVKGTVAVAEQGSSLLESVLLKQSIGKVPLFCTRDSLLYPSLATGFEGAFSLLSCLYPRATALLFDLVFSRRHGKALALWQELAPLCALLEGARGPLFVKWMLHRRGFCTPAVRLPLTLPSAGSLLAFEKACARFERAFPFLLSGEPRHLFRAF